jgi:hypothetical protein
MARIRSEGEERGWRWSKQWHPRRRSIADGEELAGVNEQGATGLGSPSREHRTRASARAVGGREEVRRRRQRLPSIWAGPGRERRGGGERKGARADGEASGPARLTGPAGRIGGKGGRKEDITLFFFSKLIFQIHFQKVFESF